MYPKLQSLIDGLRRELLSAGSHDDGLELHIRVATLGQHSILEPILQAALAECKRGKVDGVPVRLKAGF